MLARSLHSLSKHGTLTPRRYVGVAFLLFALLASHALAQTPEPPPPGYEGATVVEKPNAKVPLDVDFTDEDGKTVRLADFYKPGRPVLFMLVYYRCPMLCNLTLNGVVKAVQSAGLTPGKDFEIVSISFDPREGPDLARAKKANYLNALGTPVAEKGWHFLTSSRPEAARTLGDAIGFGYKLDPKGEQYLHQAAIYVCTPDGRVARTMQGVQFDPDVLHDSLVDASAGKITSGLFGFALSCGLVHFDPATGKYTWAAVAIMRVTGIITVLALGALIGTLVYRESHKKPGAEADAP